MRTPLARIRMSGVVLAVLVVAVPAIAAAPVDQYEQFDQTTPEISDTKTLLVWARRQVKKNLDHTQADAVCGTAGVVFASGGRIPTVKELLTIVDEEPHQEYDTSFNPPIVFKAIDQLAFPDTPTDKPYWTSTPGPTAGTFYVVSFATGKTDVRPQSEQNHVRCVR